MLFRNTYLVKFFLKEVIAVKVNIGLPLRRKEVVIRKRNVEEVLLECWKYSVS